MTTAVMPSISSLAPVMMPNISITPMNESPMLANTDESDSQTPPSASPIAPNACLKPSTISGMLPISPPRNAPIAVPIPGRMRVPIAAPIAAPPAEAKPSEMASSGDLPWRSAMMPLIAPPSAPSFRPDCSPPSTLNAVLEALVSPCTGPRKNLLSVPTHFLT